MYKYFASARSKSRQVQCLTHLKQLSAALLRYADAHQHHLPDAEHWREAVRPYLKPDEDLTCPDAKTGDGYAFEPRLANVDLRLLEFPAETILLYETDVPDQKPHPPVAERRHGGSNIAFADGHARRIYPSGQKIAHTRHNELLKKVQR
jgi:prepilin-type processing-associated H-X9-DG protein